MIVLLIILVLGAILIGYFHIKALSYNKDQEYSIIGIKKDIWPFSVCWGVRILCLGLSCFRFFNEKDHIVDQNRLLVDNSKENIQNKQEQEKNKNIKDQIDKNEKNNEIIKTHKDSQSSFLIDGETKQKYQDSNNVKFNEIITGVYEMITSDDTISPETIQTVKIKIPQPITNISCNDQDKYWNLSSLKGLNYSNFVYEYLKENKKEDIVIAILDSGINTKNKILTSHLSGGINILSNNENIIDTNGHGTHIAGIILQTYPNAKILPIKITEGKDIDEKEIIKGLKYAIDQKVNIINMSFGGIGNNSIIQELIDVAVKEGIIVVAAAGNDGEDVTMYYPASDNGVLSVESVGINGLSEFSNYGADLDMPGECIYSYALTGENMLFMNGTSMASPHVAGILGSYFSLGKVLETETQVQKTFSENISMETHLVDVTKLFNIEEENKTFMSGMESLKKSLQSLNETLGKISENNVKEDYENQLSDIEQQQKKIDTVMEGLTQIYEKVGIKTGMLIELQKELKAYMFDLSDMNPDDITLREYIDENGILLKSLGRDVYRRNKNGKYESGIFDIIFASGININNNGTIKKEYKAIKNGWTEDSFSIYLGEDDDVGKNQKLGSVKFTGLAPRKVNEKLSIVTYTINKYGKLVITSVDPWNKSKQKVSTVNINNEGDVKLKENIKKVQKETDSLIQKIQKITELDPTIYLETLDINTDSINIPSTDEKTQETQETSKTIIPIVNKIDTNKTCNIKGNISYTNGEKIYHMPGCSHYADTVINTEYGERWFCSEQEARDAGWRKCKEY